MKFSNYLINKEILMERLSDIVFRSVSIPEMTKIVKTDSFHLYSVLAKEIEKTFNSRKYYYLSLTRSRAGSYHYSQTMSKPNRMTHMTILLVLDGRRLGDVAAASAVDYWGRDMRNISPVQNNEMEDRLISNKPVIRNASKYIKSVDIYVKPEKVFDNSSMITSYEIRFMKFLMDNGFNVRVFDDPTNFLVGKTGFKSGEDIIKTFTVYGQEKHDKEDSSLSYSSTAKGILDIIDNVDSEQRSKVEYELKYLNSYSLQSLKRSLQADLHNLNRNPASIKITEYARKIKAKNIEELLTKMSNILKAESKNEQKS